MYFKFERPSVGRGYRIGTVTRAKVYNQRHLRRRPKELVSRAERSAAEPTTMERRIREFRLYMRASRAVKTD
jgi:hypothetical protein